MTAAPAALAQPDRPSMVRLDSVRREPVERWRDVTGELRAVRRSVLAAQSEGLVTDVTREVGDRVAAGEVLATLDETRARIELRRAEANVAIAHALIVEREAELGKWQRDIRRLEDSFARDAASRQELDDARTGQAAGTARLESARAELAAAESQLESAKKTLTDCRIVAPFAGQVVAKRTEVGQWVQIGEPVIELVELGVIEAWIDVPERTLAYIMPADRATPPNVRVHVPALGPAAQPFELPATAISPVGDSLSRLFPVRVRIPNPQEQLRPGMSVTAQVPTGSFEPMLTVSRDAVRRGDTGSFVFMDGGGRAVMAPVEVLFPVSEGGGRRLAVRSPMLAEGVSVVTEGNERLFPGMPIMSMDGPPPGAGSPSGAGGPSNGGAESPATGG